jgi:hypothetical protein
MPQLLLSAVSVEHTLPHATAGAVQDAGPVSVGGTPVSVGGTPVSTGGTPVSTGGNPVSWPAPSIGTPVSALPPPPPLPLSQPAHAAVQRSIEPITTHRFMRTSKCWPHDPHRNKHACSFCRELAAHRTPRSRSARAHCARACASMATSWPIRATILAHRTC